MGDWSLLWPATQRPDNSALISTRTGDSRVRQEKAAGRNTGRQPINPIIIKKGPWRRTALVWDALPCWAYRLIYLGIYPDRPEGPLRPTTKATPIHAMYAHRTSSKGSYIRKWVHSLVSRYVVCDTGSGDHDNDELGPGECPSKWR